MQDIYQQALNGTLYSTAGNTIGEITIKNTLEAPIETHWIGWQGELSLRGDARPDGTIKYKDVREGHFFLVTAAYTGAFVCVLAMVKNVKEYKVLDEQLAAPNDIGPIPAPNKAVPIPVDSPRILVGCAALKNQNYVIREQLWQRTGDSCSLAANERRTVSSTTLTGRQKTSSEESTVAASLGVTAGLGWGAISASLSANLSRTSSRMQQITVTEEHTSYISETLENLDRPDHKAKSVFFLRWQLLDIVTIFNKTDDAKSSLTIAQAPVMTRGPYHLDSLAAPVEPPPASAENDGKKPAKVA